MAEYLIQDTTLTAIAEAIRGKTGGEDVIAVSAMAEQIASITGGGGGGGGTLPAGIYLSGSPFGGLPTIKRHKWFKYNGETYAAAGAGAGDGYLCYIYKWNGSAWTTVLSGTGSTGLSDAGIDCDDFHVVECNGVAHFLSGKKHAIFNGTSFTASTDLPKNCTQATLYQGKVLVHNYDVYITYEWDEATASWLTFANLSSSGSPDYMIAVGNDLYYRKSTVLYKYNEGALEQVGTLDSSVKYVLEWFVVDGKLYLLSSTSGLTKLFRYDFTTGENVLVGIVPLLYSNFWSENTNDLSFVGITTNSSNSSKNSLYQYFKLDIVEETN